jgi:modulator of FtsH protease
MNKQLFAINSRVDTRVSELSTNKVLRNTYLLLGATLAFSALIASWAVMTNMRPMGLLLTLGGYFALLFATHATRNSGWGLLFVFLLTGFLGLTLGPLVNFFLTRIPNGGQTVAMALGTTAVTFLGLSAYALISRRSFSFMRGFLVVGAIAGMVLSLVAVFFQLPMLSLAVSGMFVLIASGLILYQTGEIVNGGETNYISATVTLYVSIYNLFVSLLQLFGAANSDD